MPHGTSLESRQPPPGKEDIREWMDKLYRNRVLSSYFGVKLDAIPTTAVKLFDWVNNSVSDIVDTHRDHELLQLRGAEARKQVLIEFAQSFHYYCQAEQAGNDTMAIYWLGRSEGAKELASQPEYGMGNDCTFIGELFMRLPEFDGQKFTQRILQIKQASAT
jgi:hypothetical protein